MSNASIVVAAMLPKVQMVGRYVSARSAMQTVESHVDFAGYAPLLPALFVRTALFAGPDLYPFTFRIDERKRFSDLRFRIRFSTEITLLLWIFNFAHVGSIL